VIVTFNLKGSPANTPQPGQRISRSTEQRTSAPLAGVCPSLRGRLQGMWRSLIDLV
jgi:hypothetical protein